MDNTTTHGEGERCDRFARHPNLRLSERAICFHCAHFDQPIDADGECAWTLDGYDRGNCRIGSTNCRACAAG